jgi:hypothetical protein
MRDAQSVQKLQGIFDARYRWLQEGGILECVGEGSPWGIEEDWTIYMNSLDCLVIDKEDLIESFIEMVNFGEAVKKCVCLLNPAKSVGWLLVHHELADKCLALGGLP